MTDDDNNSDSQFSVHKGTSKLRDSSTVGCCCCGGFLTLGHAHKNGYYYIAQVPSSSSQRDNDEKKKKALQESSGRSASQQTFDYQQTKRVNSLNPAAEKKSIIIINGNIFVVVISCKYILFELPYNMYKVTLPHRQRGRETDRPTDRDHLRRREEEVKYISIRNI